MHGEGVGTLNVYGPGGQETPLLSRTGTHGPMWRFAQASLGNHGQPYQVYHKLRCVEYMLGWQESSPKRTEDMALRPTCQVTESPLSCHPTLVASLRGDLVEPSTGGHCLNFWYHMYGHNVGMLQVYINDRKISGEGNGVLLWSKEGNQGQKWLEASVSVARSDAFWFVFVSQSGMSAGGDVALDDIQISQGPCPQEPTNDSLSAGLVVGVTLAVGVLIAAGLFLFNRWWSASVAPPPSACCISTAREPAPSPPLMWK
ncbi:hypothetical protein CRUP_022836 [Coryphaenoides rupestris]|nr:hypothetical protein CRUP_022836 [Coryphaenoides rupestris]